MYSALITVQMSMSTFYQTNYKLEKNDKNKYY